MCTNEHYCIMHQFLHFTSASTVLSAFILPGVLFLPNSDENQFIHHCLGIQLYPYFILLQSAYILTSDCFSLSTKWMTRTTFQSPAYWSVSPYFSVSQDTLEWLSSVSVSFLQLTPTYWVTNLWRRPRNFSFSYSCSYGTTHEVISMSWVRDTGNNSNR